MCPSGGKSKEKKKNPQSGKETSPIPFSIATANHMMYIYGHKAF